MRTLANAAGVDFDQWKALTRVALKLDLRTAATGRGGFGRETGGVGILVVQGVFYLVLGAVLGIFVWTSRDLFLTGLVLLSYTLFMVGTTVLLDHNSALTSPTDYQVLGFRPVSSRTYFAAKLANALVYTTGMTTVVVLLPVLALMLRHGPIVGLAGLIACYACSISAALAILTGYAALMRIAGAEALNRALSYVQLAMSFFVYGGYLLMSRFISQAAVSAYALPKTGWLLLYPGTWFASYLEIAAGRAGLFEIGAAGLSVAAMVSLASGLGGRLSLEYSERLGAVGSASERARAARTSSPGFWFRSGEGRAMALLIRSQFRNDQRFRMSVLSILPMTLLYLFLAAGDGAIRDPLAAAPVVTGSRRGSGPGFSLVTMAVMMFPSMLKMSLSRSDAFRASWVFFACPADRTRMIRSAKSVLVVFYLFPYLAFVAALYTYMIGNVWHVLVHTLLLGLLSHLCLQVLVLMDPDLPFSRPPQKGQQSAMVFMFMFVITFVTILVDRAASLIYSSTLATVMMFATLVLASVVLDQLTKTRIEHQARSLEFQG
jgi:ABC-2 type transport system permease protein